MAKYDNILDQDFYELFGKEVVEKAISFFPLHKEKAREYLDMFRNGKEDGKAVVLFAIMDYVLKDDKELKLTLKQEAVKKHLVYIH